MIDLLTAVYKPASDDNNASLDHQRYFADINYTDSAGLSDIRTKTAGYISQIVGVPINPKTVFLTNGADHAISVALSATSQLKSGDVYVPSPYYFKYPHQIDLYHKGRLATQTANASEPLNIPQMMTAGRNNQTSAIIFNNPNNPLGLVHPASVLDRLIEASAPTGTHIIYDIVYGDTLFNPADAKHIRLSTDEPLKDRLWLVGSISKSHGIPGWRLGFLVCPEESIELIEHITEILSSNISTISQFLLNDVLTLPSFDMRRQNLATEMSASYDQMLAHLQEHHPWLAPHLLKPQAGIFCCMDVRDYCTDDQKLKQDLQDRGVRIKVGSALGYPGFIRLPLTAQKNDYAQLFDYLEQILIPEANPSARAAAQDRQTAGAPAMRLVM